MLPDIFTDELGILLLDSHYHIIVHRNNFVTAPLASKELLCYCIIVHRNNFVTTPLAFKVKRFVVLI